MNSCCNHGNILQTHVTIEIAFVYTVPKVKKINAYEISAWKLRFLLILF